MTPSRRVKTPQTSSGGSTLESCMASRAQVMDSYLASAAGYRFLPPIVIVAASVAYRLPRLISAGDLHSDAAVVGLQAAHFLRGELSPLLWGSGYQTSVDSAVAALFFASFGPTPLSLRLSTFVGFVVLTLLAYATLRRHLSPVK